VQVRARLFISRGAWLSFLHKNENFQFLFYLSCDAQQCLRLRPGGALNSDGSPGRAPGTLVCTLPKQARRTGSVAMEPGCHSTARWCEGSRDYSSGNYESAFLQMP